MKILFSIIIYIVIAGCSHTTTSEWQDIYTDDIYQFLISEDGNSLVFVGIKYHYVFVNNDELKDLLLWEDRRLLKASFNENFVVRNSNKIMGSYSLICNCAHLTLKQTQWLKTNGFNKGDSNIYMKTSSLSGKRYLADDVVSNNEYANLTHPYEITIEENYFVTNEIKHKPSSSFNDNGGYPAALLLLTIALPFILVEELLPQPNSSNVDRSRCQPCYSTSGFKRNSTFLD